MEATVVSLPVMSLWGKLFMLVQLTSFHEKQVTAWLNETPSPGTLLSIIKPFTITLDALLQHM